MNVVWYILFWLVVLAIWYAWPSKAERERKRERVNPPTPYTPLPPDALIQRSRFKHRGYFHNRYWTKGKGSGLRPWV